MEEGTRWFKEQDPEKITLTSYDGLKLSAYLLPAEKKSRNVLLLMHGYRCDGFSDFSCLYQFYHDQGISSAGAPPEKPCGKRWKIYLFWCKRTI